ncbi:MAG: hypothetical protein SNI32_07340 [Rikenellaceae bacterium]
MTAQMTITAAVALMHEDNTLTSVRVLWGGEPEWTGEVLMKYYPSPAKIEELLERGDMLELERDAEHCSYCLDDIESWGDCLTKTHKSLAAAFAKYNDEVDYIYIYIYNSGKWYCHKFNE